jgi:chromate reductase, NAD(P)H dehydrogenase (quinone)
MKICGVSGSLRSSSSNSALLKACVRLAPAGTEVVLFEGIGGLPHFTPDLDNEAPPPAVAAWRQLLAASEAVIVCTPEYAHGVPGSLKNALDWIVSSGEFRAKPVLLLMAGTNDGKWARDSLTATLEVMEANVLHAHSFTVANARKKLDADGNSSDAQLEDALRKSLAALAGFGGRVPAP